MNPSGEPRTLSLDELRLVAREGLLRAGASVAGEGIPGSDGQGQLIRPLLALAGVRRLEPSSQRFWDGVLAIQLAHEASLLHDDVIDAAATRRGEPTLAARSVVRALLRGDHLLTAGYRAAARTGSLDFVQLFARGVERTVAWEAEQGASAGVMIDRARAEAISLGKSGELMGCALALGSVLEGDPTVPILFGLGRQIGLFYQMFDDLIDYCPHAETGKPALGDYAAGRWTWVLGELPSLPFGMEPLEAAAMLHRPDEASSPMQRAVAELDTRANRLEREATALLPNPQVLGAMLHEWLSLARSAVEAESAGAEGRGSGDRDPADEDSGPRRSASAADSPVTRRSRVTASPVVGGTGSYPADGSELTGSPGPIQDRDREEPINPDVRAAAIRSELLRRIPAADASGTYLAANSRSFRFASRFFTDADAERVARIYVYCRITDDLVDQPPDGFAPEEMLDAWVALSRAAYGGKRTGLSLLDEVMKEMSAAEVPFSYATELAEGMRMDVRGERYASTRDLRRYTYRVASVVGLWLTRLWGMSEPRILEGAEHLGHAMQLTNILRDVGEDLEAGRLYLPADLMRAHGLTEADLLRMQGTGKIDVNYRALIEVLMEVADHDYRVALDVVPDLPLRFARAIAASAHIYRGIHAEIRRNRYDNLSRRAHTTQMTKARLAMGALWELHRRSAGSTAPSSRAAFITHGTE